MAGDYWIDTEQVLAECCSCILPNNCEGECGPGRLDLFRQWLFKSSSDSVGFDELKFRLAPSIIVRSEAELFGVSSPRFAIRAYLTDRSFVNIRRNSVLQRMIVGAVKDPDVRDGLVSDLQRHEFAWTADSLIEIPQRFKLCPKFARRYSAFANHQTEEGGYQFLTAHLGNEFGESFDGPLVPFVTHLNVGGGLCAQASCFMSLCLSECDQILGISEITKLAWAGESQSPNRSDAVIHIHGLSSERVTNFFSKAEIGLNAQLQTFVGEENNFRFIKFAIQNYIANGIPLNVITSISRMKGWHDINATPILRLNEFVFDEGDRSKLPLGIPDDRVSGLGKKQKNDHHCVVVIGASSNRVCINDPATFPFVEASYNQLIDARAYLPKSEDEIGSESVDEWTNIDPDEFASEKPAPFRMIAVTTREVNAPLLDFVMEKKQGESQDVITRPGRRGVMRTAFNMQQEERLLMGQKDEIVPQLGTYFLVEKLLGESSKVLLKAHRLGGLPTFDWALLQGISDGWYWIQMVKHPVKLDDQRNMLWFWPATLIENDADMTPSVVLVQDNEDEDIWEQR